MNTKFAPLQEAIEKTQGGQKGVARICTSATGREIKQGHVSNWLKRGNVPSDCAIAIERAVGVEKERLCPGYAWHLIPEVAP